MNDLTISIIALIISVLTFLLVLNNRDNNKSL